MDTSSESGLPEANNNSGQDELQADISAGNNADIRMPSGTDDPLSDAEIQKYREEINKMDRIILDAVKRRTKVSQAVGKTRMGSGGTRLVHTREISILNQFRDELGEEGPAIASALLRMGRGKLG
ncbi:MAG: chorismate mutase [Corynebacterium casei]